jgi:hypothetical protein
MFNRVSVELLKEKAPIHNEQRRLPVWGAIEVTYQLVGGVHTR